MIDHDPASRRPNNCCSEHDAPAQAARGPRLTRRHLFGALAAGGAAYGMSRLSALATPNALDALTGPGLALEDAVRLPHPTTSTTTTTTTVPPTTTIPLADGEVLFPIIVGEDDACFVLDNFGDCRGTNCSRAHEGVDIMADRGLPIVAVADGILTKQYVDRGLTYGAGNGWTLTDEANNVVYKFFHLADFAEGLAEGDEVVQGQVIGYVGETGTSGAGNSIENFHLHFEYRPGNVARDSFDMLQRAPHVRFEGE